MAHYYKCQAIWNCVNRGWTETYYVKAEDLPLPPASGGDPINAENFIAVNGIFKTAILTPRALLNGKQSQVIATRVSGINRMIPGEQPNDGAFLDYKGMPPTNQQADCDNPPSTLVTTLYDAFTQRKHQIHLRGIWDTIDDQGGQLVMPPGFNALFTSFATAITRPGWGWPSRAGNNKQDITGYLVLPNGAVEFELGGNLFEDGDVGKVKQVRISSVNFGQSTLNGELTVKVNTRSECVSTERIAVAPFSEEGVMRYNPAAWKQHALCVATKIGSRDTGASIFLGRGRAKKRVRY